MAAQPVDIEADVAGLLAGDDEALTTIRGQHAIATTDGRVRRVRLWPSEPASCPEAIQAVTEADTLVLGPGSWFTSVLPHFLVPGLADVIMSAPARRVLVLNLGTDGETAGWALEEHLHSLAAHAPKLRIDVVLADSRIVRDHTGLSGAAESLGGQLVVAPMAVADGSPRHDEEALAAVLRTVL
jgi:uncharacterized cofD-like protein